MPRSKPPVNHFSLVCLCNLEQAENSVSEFDSLPVATDEATLSAASVSVDCHAPTLGQRHFQDPLERSVWYYSDDPLLEINDSSAYQVWIHFSLLEMLGRIRGAFGLFSRDFGPQKNCLVPDTTLSRKFLSVKQNLVKIDYSFRCSSGALASGEESCKIKSNKNLIKSCAPV